MKGYARLVKAGYDPHEAHKAFEQLAKEVKALGIEEPYFFSLIRSSSNASTRSRSWPPSTRAAGAWVRKTITTWCTDSPGGAAEGPGPGSLQERDPRDGRHQPASLLPGRRPLLPGRSLSPARRQERSQKALQAFQTAEKLAPNFAPTYKSLGVQHMKAATRFGRANNFNEYLTLALTRGCPARLGLRAAIHQFAQVRGGRGH